MSDTEDRDKVTLGTTSEGTENLSSLMELGWFADEMDAYKVAIAVALARKLPATDALSGVQTKWNVGSLDRDLRLKNLILARDPAAQRPYQVAERLADAGLRLLKLKLIDQEEMLTDIFRTTE